MLPSPASHALGSWVQIPFKCADFFEAVQLLTTLYVPESSVPKRFPGISHFWSPDTVTFRDRNLVILSVLLAFHCFSGKSSSGSSAVSTVYSVPFAFTDRHGMKLECIQGINTLLIWLLNGNYKKNVTFNSTLVGLRPRSGQNPLFCDYLMKH